MVAAGGSIINQGLVAALAGIANFASYCAAKGALVALTGSCPWTWCRAGAVNALARAPCTTPLMEPDAAGRGGGTWRPGWR